VTLRVKRRERKEGEGKEEKEKERKADAASFSFSETAQQEIARLRAEVEQLRTQKNATPSAP
jgi:hypothetical protein